MEVRKASASDAAELFGLVCDFATSSVPHWTAFLPAFERVVEADDAAAWVAEIDGSIAGYVVVQRQVTLFANGPIAFVQELMVAQEHRRSGVGAALMGAAEEWAAGLGCAYVALATRRAGEFYRAVGYSASAEFFKKELEPEG